ncbi:RDD family protein, partial [Actinomadura adrarensis]
MDGGQPVHLLASTRRRVVARLLDMGVAYIATMATVGSAMAVALLSPDFEFAQMAWVVLTAMVLTFVASTLLRVARLVWWGCTVGQRIAGIRVVQEHNGLRPTWRQAFNRWVVHNRMIMIPLLNDVVRHRRDQRLGQCIHDRQAGTVVVMAQAPPPAARTATQG